MIRTKAKAEANLNPINLHKDKDKALEGSLDLVLYSDLEVVDLLPQITRYHPQSMIKNGRMSRF
jgi:hypothetical protein